MQASEEHIREMASHAASWLAAPNEEASVALTSRVRLARNLSGFRFPGSADEETLQKVVTYASAARDRSKALSQGAFYRSTEIPDLARDFLIERHLISPNFLDGAPNRAAFIDEDERTSVMINEEDHLRIQSMLPGLDLTGAYERANEVDEEFCGSLDIDFDSDFGYLTACPTNVGTGLRASVLIHLPGLVLTREIDNVIERITKLGFVVRGFYGEGSDVLGNLFQISNQTTLGITERESLHNIESIVRTIIDEETTARERMIEEARPQIEDKVWRAFGILKYARTLTSEETMNLLSAVRLGISLGMIDFVKFEQVNEILLLSQPAHLQMTYGENMDSEQRDSVRAQMVREKLRIVDRRREQ